MSVNAPMRPDDRAVEAAHRARLDAPPRELWPALDARAERREHGLTLLWLVGIVGVVFVLVSLAAALPP